MKYNYEELTGKCKNCGGCILLENLNWLGTNKCEYADEPIQQIKRMLGIQERIKNE